MNAAYDPTTWSTFYAVIGGSAATLTGLLAVALSINVRRIMGTPTHAARSREALIGFVILILLSILMLIPEQSQEQLGIELLLLGFVSLTVVIALQHRTLSLLHITRRRRWIARVSLLDSTAVFVVISGFSLVAGIGGGLYWLVPTTFISLIWGLVNSWQLIVWLPEKEKK
ncbi:MAG TPA: hypothetical protein VJZ75_05735 [Candidatus Bathyarchaeia archaeon]|nr:hypothetical protein [Candidatus Bathyarchaeia archaeon]